jgi:hypothetical protein
MKSLTFWRTIVAVLAFALAAYTLLAPSELPVQERREVRREVRVVPREEHKEHKEHGLAFYGPRTPFSQIGILSTGTGPIPLFARPTRRAADRWNYFAVSNQTVPQKLPVFRDGRDCGKRLGCPEVSDGDVLDVRGAGPATVTLYARD